MADSLTVNGTFYLSLATLAFAFLSASLAYTIKSKCSSVKCCCGMLEIIRDIDAEVELEESLPQPIEPLNSINQTRRSRQLSKTETIDFKKSMNIV